MLPSIYNIDPFLPSCNIYIRQLGEEAVAAGRSCGPGIWRHVVFHYIYEGRGTFTINQKSYPLEAGQAFILLPNTVSYYEADTVSPWKYKWVQIWGSDQTNVFSHLGIDAANPVLTDTPDGLCGKALLSMIERAKAGASFFTLNGDLWQFLNAVAHCSNTLPAASPPQVTYVRKALEYIHDNYWRLPHVNEIASFLGLDRSYLNKLFHAHVGLSPQAYILQHRIETAKTLLRMPEYTVEHIGKSVGYEDVHAFSKAFKKQTGMSPGVWRKSGLYL